MSNIERVVQDSLYITVVNLKKNGNQALFNVTPNVHFFSKNWESDLLMTNFRNFVIEFEIKATRSDFFNDLSKPKHKNLESKQGFIPNLFYYVVKQGEINVEDVPVYAGLYEFRIIDHNIYGQFAETFRVKEAPVLHESPLTLELEKKLNRAVYFKYWQQRTKRNHYRK